MDWILGLGHGSVNEENNQLEYNIMEVIMGITKENHSGLLWQTALQFYLTEMWNIRLNLISMNYQAKIPSANDEGRRE